ncbi:MAG: DJ-1/PfpI family protein [Zetaproteobacteria bacterium]|nr:MAG: DJ-1/PfpI family protein [Zetaproteobacteria bacterium]
MASVLVPFAQGVEEIEFVSVVDILRRAGIEVCTAALGDELIVCGRSGIRIQADARLDEVLDRAWDMVVLPGGLPNAHILRDDARVRALVERLHEAGRMVAAICAAPTALAAYGLAAGRRVTSYPACREEMEQLQPDAVYVDDAVVEDAHLVTSRGPGTALAFALRLVARLCGEDKAAQLRAEVVAE